jgi:DNA polymerase
MIDIDFETRSKADIMECGAWRYSEDPSTEVLCMQWSVNGAEPELWIPGMPSPSWTTDKKEFIRLGGQVRAHNAAFEQAIWENICISAFGWIFIQPIHWLDTMAQAAAMSLPMSLEDCGAALQLPVVKDTEGKRVMQQLSRPRKPSKDNPKEWMEKEDYPDKFNILYSYCSTDVKAQTAIGNFLPQLTRQERWVWVLDRVINRRGVGIDIDLAHKALEVIDAVETRGIARIKEITGGEVETASQVAKLLNWARNQGVEITSLTKESVSNTLKEGKLPDNVKEVLQIRQMLGKSSTKKIVKMIEAASRLSLIHI